MAYSQSLAGRVRDVLSPRRGIEERKMFGGVGFLLNSHMLVGVWKDSLVVRLSPNVAERALQEPDVGPFDITGRPMRGWVLVAPAGLEGDDQIRSWVDRACRFVQTLPPK